MCRNYNQRLVNVFDFLNRSLHFTYSRPYGAIYVLHKIYVSDICSSHKMDYFVLLKHSLLCENILTTICICS